MDPMPNFIPTEYKQSVLLSINFEDQLQPGTFEYAIHYLIEKKLDLSGFEQEYKNEFGGRIAYPPSVLLKIVLFAYSKGITSSREIAWCCKSNIIFKALACDLEPHFTTIADFVSRQPSKMESVFEQVLLVCHEQNLLGNELFAIDGCKMRSDASKTWSGTFKELEEKREKIKKLIKHHVHAHQAIDKTETDEEEQRERHEKAIATLNKAHDKIDHFLKSNIPRMGQGKRPKEVKSNITDNDSAKMTTSKGTIQGYNGIASVDAYCQVIIDAQAIGEGQEHHVLQPILKTIKARYKKHKISKDLYKDGTQVTADTGYANEENMQYLKENCIAGYIPDNQFRSRDPKFQDQKKKYGKRHQAASKTHHKYFTADQFKVNIKKKTCTCPAGQSMWLKNEFIDSHGNHKLFFEGPMSKCRDCPMKKQCMRNPASADTRDGHGRQASFIVKKGNSSTPYTDWMKKRIDSDYGKMIYAHRMSTVEPVFANIGTNKGLDRFTLRGKGKVQGQWQLYCTVHNIEKLMNYGELH
jgi:transposase